MGKIKNSNKKITGSETNSEEENINNINRVYGWVDATDCANTIWASIHSSLLSGELVFAYRGTPNGEFLQIVVVKNSSPMQNGGFDFSVGTMKQGFSSLVPHIPANYLDQIVLEDLEKSKVDKDILETYKQLSKFYKV